MVQGTALGMVTTIGIGGTTQVDDTDLAQFPPPSRYAVVADLAPPPAFDAPLGRKRSSKAARARRTQGGDPVPVPLAPPAIEETGVSAAPRAFGGRDAGGSAAAMRPLAPVEQRLLPARSPGSRETVIAFPLAADVAIPPADAAVLPVSADTPFLIDLGTGPAMPAATAAVPSLDDVSPAAEHFAPRAEGGALSLAADLPVFDGDAAAAPWLGDPARKRQAAIALGDMRRPGGSSPPFVPAAAAGGSMPHAAGKPMSTAPDRDGDEPPSGVPDPDLDVGADTTATDGQAREGDLLSLQTLSRGGLALSGGYSSIEGPIASIKLSRTNIGAPGRDLTLSARYSKVQTLVELGASDGNILGSKLAIAPTFFYSRSTAVGFDKADQSSLFVQTARGINFYVGRSLDKGLRIAANYRFSDEEFGIRQKNARCSVAIHGTPFCNAIGPTKNSVFSLALSLDRRDSAADPTRGFQLRVTQDIAGIGGTTRYFRVRVGGTFHRRLSGNIDISLGLEGGYMKGFGGRDIPLFDRFYIGGNSLRGFDLRGLGPKVVPTNAALGRVTAIGGRAYYVGRLEASVRLDGAFDKFGVSPSLFIDAGSAFGAKKSELGPGEVLIGNSAKPRVAVGFGLSFNLSPGKLRFNIAHPVARQPGDRAKIFSISFGTAF